MQKYAEESQCELTVTGREKKNKAYSPALCVRMGEWDLLRSFTFGGTLA